MELGERKKRKKEKNRC